MCAINIDCVYSFFRFSDVMVALGEHHRYNEPAFPVLIWGSDSDLARQFSVEAEGAEFMNSLTLFPGRRPQPPVQGRRLSRSAGYRAVYWQAMRRWRTTTQTLSRGKGQYRNEHFRNNYLNINPRLGRVLSVWRAHTFSETKSLNFESPSASRRFTSPALFATMVVAT